MPVVTSVINLKGGVGKTTLTVALAHYLAIEHRRRVLVIDLDPQTNATVSLIREHDWKSRDAHNQTLYGLYRDLLDGTHHFDAGTAIVANASNVDGGVFGLDLLPCSIRLIGIQDDITRLVRPGVGLSAPVTVLRDHLASVLDTYDHVLIDCPPALGVVTQAGLLISDVYLVPVVPDILSLQGVVPVLDLIARISRRMSHHIAALGTVVSKYHPHNRLHARILLELRQGSQQGIYPPLFATLIPELPRIAEAADVYAHPHHLRQKYGRAHKLLVALTREFLLRAERVSGVAEIAATQRELHTSLSRGIVPPQMLHATPAADTAAEQTPPAFPPDEHPLPTASPATSGETSAPIANGPLP